MRVEILILSSNSQHKKKENKCIKHHKLNSVHHHRQKYQRQICKNHNMLHKTNPPCKATHWGENMFIVIWMNFILFTSEFMCCVTVALLYLHEKRVILTTPRVRGAVTVSTLSCDGREGWGGSATPSAAAVTFKPGAPLHSWVFSAC